MKKSVLLLLLFTIVSTPALYSQEWMHRHDGTTSMLDEAADVVMLNGRTYIAGSSFSATTGWDMYVAVLDADGNELFSRTITTPGDQKAVRILPLNDDRFTVVGQGASGAGPAEVVVHRFSNEGAQMQTSNIGLTPGVWLTTVKDAVRYSSEMIIVLVDGVNELDLRQSLVLAINNGQVAWGEPNPTIGNSWGTRLILAGPLIAAVGYYQTTTVNAFYSGFDAQGNLVFHVPIDTGGDDYASDAGIDQNGNFYVTGWVEAGGSSTAYAAKADPNGNLLYQSTLPGETLPGTRAIDLELTGNGEAVYLIREETSNGFATRTVKLNTNGEVIWDKTEAPTGAATDNAPLFAGVSAIVVDSVDARLYWMSAIDDQRYSDEITYNIYISETPGGQNFDTPFATVVGQTWYRFAGMESGKTYHFVVRASDGVNEDTNTREKSTSIAAGLHITTTSIPDAERGTAYSAQLEAENGLEPYSWSVVSGSLPTGLVLGTDGLISGTTDDAAGDYPFTVEVEDANMTTAQQDFTLNLVPAPLQIVTVFLPNGAPNVPYNETLLAKGGTPPYTWTLVSGELPDGLSLNPVGSVSGTPTTLESYDFTLRVTDALLVEVEREYTVEIVVVEDLIVTKDTTLQGGTYDFRNIRVQSGATLVINGDATLSATDSVTVDGTIWTPCNDLLLSGAVMHISGDVMDTCTAPGNDPGDLTIHATAQMILGDTTLSPDQSNIVSHGNVTITDELGITPDQYIVTPGLQSASSMAPVGTLTADILNAGTSAADPLVVEFIATGADPDGGPVNFDFNFGDGNTEAGILPYDGETAVMEHAYNAPGTYTATLTIRDDEGATGMAEAQVHVYADSMLNDPGLGLAVEPTSMLVDIEDSVAYYPESGINTGNSIASYSWDFGDGATSNDEAPAHLYAAPGRYNVTLNAIDDSGNTGSASAIVYVFNPDSTQALQGGTGLSKAPAALVPRFIWAARVRGKNFNGYSSQWLWIAGWIAANSGADGDSSRSGKRGGYTNLRVNGPLNIGPLPGGLGIPPFIGGGNGGNGGAGRQGKGRRSTRGGKGGNGGSTRITAKNLNVSGGTFSTGSGGDGGDATLVCNNGKDANAYGGSGGKPGRTLRLIGTKSCTFSGPVSFVLGKGGDGGDATATACKGMDACPRAEDGGNAIARAGRGNGQAKKAMVLGRPNGLNNITVSGGNGGKGGDGTATGGDGGVANCPNTAFGGDGGRASATGGNGGKSGLRSTRRAMAMAVAPGSFMGGDGGDANSTGGNGGAATANPVPPKSVGCDADGVNTDAHGGDGNRAYGRNGDYGKSTVNGVNMDGAPGSIKLDGCEGGDATATGGDGGDGNTCCPGGDGGDAVADGGERGERAPRSIHGGGVVDPIYGNGDATATGGNGGMAGPCCNPPSQGQPGGSGGNSNANALDPFGVFTSNGGNGGSGGDGKPAGDGGGAGIATGSQTGNAADGTPGGPGNICKIQVEVYIHFDLPLGQLNPGTYQVPLYKNKNIDPSDFFGFITINVNGIVFNEGAGLLLGQGGQIGIDATSLTGGTPPVSWPTWYPIGCELEAVYQGSSPTAQLQIGGGFNSQPIDNDQGNGGPGNPFTIGISAVGSTPGKFDFIGMQSNSDFFLPDLTICILFEDP